MSEERPRARRRKTNGETPPRSTPPGSTPSRPKPPAADRRPAEVRPVPPPAATPPPPDDFHELDPGAGQNRAINRSRPIYPDSRPVRRRGPGGGPPRSGPANRNGGGNGAPRGNWNGRGGNRDSGANRGTARDNGRPRNDRNRRPARNGARDAFPAREPERSNAPLPANPREAALRILHAVDTRSAFSDRLLEGAHAEPGVRLGGVPEREQALLHELVKGTLRWRGRLDHALDALVHIGLGQVQPWIKNVLRLGAYQILFLDRVPPHAAVDESVKLAHKYGHPGTAGLVNSVLRRLDEAKANVTFPEGEDAESLAVWGSHPLWLVERWLARFGVEQTRALMLANNRPARVGLRVNTLRVTREGLLEKLAAAGVTATAGTLSPDLVWVESHHSPLSLAVFREGLCTVQDESECLVARLVAPDRYERVLDLCAAPGGKSTHLAELMQDEGEVWSLERAEARMEALESTVRRMGVSSVHVVNGDGRTYPFPMPFDRVLVDAPCSGLGVLSRRADARWRKGPEILAEMPPIQLELLAAAGLRARPGGVLVYSVCSFEPEETTHLVERFLRQNPMFVLETAHGLLPDAVVDENGFMSVLPHVHGCDGAFAARFRRT